MNMSSSAIVIARFRRIFVSIEIISRGVSLIRMPRGMVHHNTDFSQSLKTHMHSVLLMDLQAPMEICHGGDVDQEHNNTIIQLASQSTCIV